MNYGRDLGNSMRHLDLFSGIGGFSLAVDTVWHEEENEHIFVEWDDFCTEVLKKHWPQAEYNKDIRTFVANARSKKSDRIPARQDGEEVLSSWLGNTDLLTGGFPCQPFSQAGRRKGTADDRYLWPPMLEAISLFRPRWVIAENVAGLVTWDDGVVLETVCSDLEKEGYEVCPFVIPACAVGAPHRRDRVWVIAHASDAGTRSQDGAITDKDGTTSKGGGAGIRQRNRETSASGTLATDTNASDATSERSDTWRTKRTRQQRSAAPVFNDSDAPDTGSTRLQRSRQDRSRQHGQRNRDGSDERPDWNQDWPEIAAALCRVDDGLPRRMDRTPRLKALGNAIVPQVAAEIMRAIKSAIEG